MATTISIQQVLSEIRASTAHSTPFLLRVVKSTNKPKGTRGTIRTYGACLKGFPKRTVPSDQPAKANNQGEFLYKEHDIIPIIDLEAGEKFRTIPISHIIGYNKYLVIH